jgi:iron complex transport system substrate-binding protein
MSAQVRAYAPEVLVLSPCGAGLESGVQQAAELAALPGWWALPAVRAGRVFVADHSLFSRPGPRSVQYRSCVVLLDC